jgi:predicted nucleic acid-binding protein
MILVDTSVWIRVLNRRATDSFLAAVDQDEVVTCLPVMQEVLQGIDDARAFLFAKAAFAIFGSSKIHSRRMCSTKRCNFTGSAVAQA